jgi:HlyD family secretion protein
VGQLLEQAQGAGEQIGAKTREIEFVGRELESVRELWKKNLVSIQRVTALERDAARLQGERGALISSAAQVKGKVTETELQIIQIDEDLRSEIGKELADIRAKLTEFNEKRTAAADQLTRVDIRAPQDGTVHQLSVHTIGGVLAAGEQIMLIVPGSDSLAIEAKVAPQDIDQLRPGQRATVRFSAFNQRTTPEITGEVKVVSADVTQDHKTGLSYYTVRLTWPEQQAAQLNPLKLIPGMPAECFIQTGTRSVISYLTKPLADQMARAWRER